MNYEKYQYYLVEKRFPTCSYEIYPLSGAMVYCMWSHFLCNIISACDRLSRGPLLTDPFPTDQYIDRFGVNLTVPCAGYFGCSDAGDFMGDVDWFVKENGIYKKAVNVSSRYSVTQSEL